MDKTEFSYIGRKACGCVVAAIVDDPNHKRDVASFLSEMVRADLTVERVTHDYVREHLTFKCPHKQPKAGQLPLFDEAVRS